LRVAEVPVSEFDRGAFLQRRSFVPLRDEFFDDSESEQAAAGAAAPAVEREGLPPSFRMRHDAHYVDLITSRTSAPPVQLVAIKDIDHARPFRGHDLGPLVESIAACGVVQPLHVRRRGGGYELIAGAKRLAAAVAAGLTDVPCLLWDADDERARALAKAENLRLEREDIRKPEAPIRPGLAAEAIHQLIERLATIESCLNLLSGGERPLRERVATNLVKAEAHRARWMAEASAVLSGAPPLAKKPLNPARVVESAVRSYEAESRLAGVNLAFAADAPACSLAADERLLSLALTGVAGAMLDLLQGAGGGTITIGIRARAAARMLGIEFSQGDVAAPDAWAPSPDGRPAPGLSGSPAASPLGLAVARQVARLHGGRVEVAEGPQGGCTVTLVLPFGD